MVASTVDFPYIYLFQSLRNKEYLLVRQDDGLKTVLVGHFRKFMITMTYILVQVFRSGPNKIYGRRPLKNLSGYGLLKQTTSLQIF